jgi:hypothetical protein
MMRSSSRMNRSCRVPVTGFRIARSFAFHENPRPEFVIDQRRKSVDAVINRVAWGLSAL